MKKFNSHCAAFQKRLKKLGVEGYLVTHVPDLFYLAGYSAEGCLGIIGSRHAAMLVPGLAADQAAALAPGFEILTNKKASEAFANIIQYAAGKHWASVGYDPYH